VKKETARTKEKTKKRDAMLTVEYDRLFDIAQTTIRVRGEFFESPGSGEKSFGDEVVPGATAIFHGDGTPSCVTLWGFTRHFGDAPPREALRRALPGVPWAAVFGLLDAGARHADFCIPGEDEEDGDESGSES